MNSKIKGKQNQITINKHTISKSKLTVSKTSSTVPTNMPNFTTKRNNRNQDADRESYQLPRKFPTPDVPINKIAAIDNTVLYSFKKIGKRRNPLVKEKHNINPVNSARETSEMSVQTNECEILDHLLIVGDFKIMRPSESVIAEVDQLRKEKLKDRLMSTRKFEEHSIKDEHHLDDLREFLDKSFITRKPHAKLRDNILEDDRLIIESMDELLQRERPKTESITDIRNRIKQKEYDLLSLFDRFKK